MSELATERVYLRTGKAIVTSARAVLEGVTYFLANFTSVRVGKAGDKFVVLLVNAGRETKGLESGDREEVKSIVDTISAAIVARGRSDAHSGVIGRYL
jgi:hypothetical protein